MVAVPAAKLYTRDMNNAISVGIRNNSKITISENLRNEILSWRFLDNWTGKLEWKQEKHLVVKIFTDASNYKWGGYLNESDKKIEIGDFWTDEMLSFPIMVQEAKALLFVLKSIKDRIKGNRVDTNVDNQALISAWNNEGSKSTALNQVLKEIFQLTLDLDMVLNLHYVPSKMNLADEPSRKLLKSDAMLSDMAWYTIQEHFGGVKGHTIDMMALDSNCMTDALSRSLKHFTPYPTPLTSGINVFAQDIDKNENCYVFPPFSLTLPVLAFIRENKLNCTIVLRPDKITPPWIPLFFDWIQDAFILGQDGQNGVLKFPSKKGYEPDKFGLSGIGTQCS